MHNQEQPKPHNPTTQNTMRVALLIDAENISHHHCDEILRQAQSFGRVCARHVHGNEFSWQSWSLHAGKHALKHIPTHHEALGRKNAADIGLMLDAVSLVYSGQCDAICLVTNDVDFLQMVLHLRERGFNVFGMGTESAAPKLQTALDRFLMIRPARYDQKKETHIPESQNQASANTSAKKGKKTKQNNSITKGEKSHRANANGTGKHSSKRPVESEAMQINSSAFPHFEELQRLEDIPVH